MTDLPYLSATEALRLFRSRELSPVELLDELIERAELVEPTVNALCHTFYEDARHRAAESARRYVGGRSPRPLEGVPVAVKADDSIMGQPNTMGSLVLKDEVADHTSTLVSRLIEAGAVIHARTAIPEFAGAAVTRSRLWGVTRNPWNPRYAAGGSSGGSAAALAAGTTTLATGSDVAGSIRIPAALCGVIGYKPPHGAVPVTPPGNLDTYLHGGSMARTVDDIELMQSVIAGPDWADITSLWPRPMPIDPDPSVAGLRVAVSADLGGWPVDPEVREATARAARILDGAGAHVEEVDLVLPPEQVLSAASTHFALSFGEFDEFIDAHRGELTPSLIANVELHRRRAAGRTLPDVQEIEAGLWLSTAGVLRRFDVILCPTLGTSRILADLDYAGDDAVQVEGREWHDLLAVALTTPFNMLGPCPVLSVPAGHDSNGVPIGVQLVGRPYVEHAIFAVARALEGVDRWFESPDSRPSKLTGQRLP